MILSTYGESKFRTFHIGVVRYKKGFFDSIVEREKY